MSICLGIDVSKASLQVALIADTSKGRKILGTHKFSNKQEGFEALLEWVNKKAKVEEVHAVMEATGIYHENIADYLYALGIKLSVELPNKIKHFAKCLNLKTKTDSVDARTIAQYGLERRPPLWKPMAHGFAEMRGLSRAIHAFKQDHARYKNRLAALRATDRTTAQLTQHIEQHLQHIKQAINQMEQELLQLAAADADFMERVERVETIKGVGKLTIIRLLCETNGFSLMANARQAVSYAGLDVMGYESGTINRKGHISKRGNPRIRQLLYTPAMVAAHRGAVPIMQLYQRVVERNPTSKRKAIVAAERKLLVLIYTLWRNNAAYDPEYRHPNAAMRENVIASDIAEAGLLLAKKTGA